MAKIKENPGITVKVYRIERWLYLHNFNFLTNVLYRLIF